MKNEKIRSLCGVCKRYTNHDVKGEHTYESDSEDVRYAIEYQIVNCCGCDTASFRKTILDIENAFRLDGDDEWDVPADVTTYPPLSHRGLNDPYLPELVNGIYSESCEAYSAGSLTLAGIGFRATIEAICNDQEILGKELSTRINGLASKGLISKKDSGRLHSIRFMGNDAAHDIRKPSLSSLRAALVIVEHLITTVYILERKSSPGLEKIIEDYSEFEDLLANSLKEFAIGEERTVANFLGKNMRLLNGSSRRFEKNLNARIGKGEFDKLSLGKRTDVEGSKEKIQLYVVMKS